MSIRISGSGEYARLTSNLPATTSYTVAVRVFVVADRPGQWRYFLGLEDATVSASAHQLLGWGADDDSFEPATSGAGSADFPTDPPIGEWFWVALVGNGTGASGYTGYWWDVTAAAGAGGWVQASRTGSSFTPAVLWLGNDSWDEWCDIRLEHCRLWGAALTATQLEAEMASATAVVTSGLIADWPLATDANDVSGADNHLTTGGSITWEAGSGIGEEAGSTLTASASEGVALGDAVSATVTEATSSLDGAISEAAVLGDSVSASLTHGATIEATVSEGITLGHRLAPGRVLDYPAEGVQLGDAVSASLTEAVASLGGSVSEGAAIGDSVSASLTHGAAASTSVDEGATLGDSVSASLTEAAPGSLSASISEGAAIGDSLSATLTAAPPATLDAAVAEGAHLGDALTATLAPFGETLEANVSEGAAFGDAVSALLDEVALLQASAGEAIGFGDAWSARVDDGSTVPLQTLIIEATLCRSFTADATLARTLTLETTI